MKKPAFFMTSVILPIVLILTMVHMGCEDVPDMEGLDDYFDQHPYLIDPREDPEAADLIISPAFVTMNVEGEQVVFQVSGGDGPFDWDVVDHMVGSIQEQASDNNAVYTANTLGMNNVIVSDSRGHVAIGTVNGEPGDMEIVPSSVSLDTNFDTVVLNVNGGTPPYSWTIVYPALGSFTMGAVGPQVTYQRTTGGDNIVLVEDYHARTANRTISQPGVLIIIPDPASVLPGGTQQFSATGGTTPYFWTVSDGSLGTVSASGLYTGNTATNAGIHSVTVWDSAGNSTAATLNQL